MKKHIAVITLLMTLTLISSTVNATGGGGKKDEPTVIERIIGFFTGTDAGNTETQSNDG